MATYATNMTDFYLEGATTVTAIGTGGAGLGNPETDYFIQGSGCISKGAWTNATKGFIIDGVAGNFTVPTNGAVIAFAKYDAAGSLAAKSAGGLQMIVGSTDAAYYHFYIGGNDTLAFDSWVPYVVDPNTATVDATTGSPGTNERWVGLLANLPTTSGPTKGNPIAMDAIRYGRCDLEYTATGCTFTGAEAWANDATRRWGLIALRNGSYLIQGFHSFGTSGASVTFSDSNKVLFWLPSGANNLTNDAVSTAFNRIEILNASSSVTWDNISISALGTRARGVFVHTAGTVAFTNCQFTDMDTFVFLAAATATGTTWRRCNAVTAPASALTESRILTPTVAVNAAGLVYNSATDTDGKLDNMTFSKGTNAHHAIDFGTSVTSHITLRGIEFTGFGSTDDANDSTVRFLATGGALNLNLVGCTVNGAAATAANFSVHDTAGVTVTKVIDPVTELVNVKNTAGTGILNARVLVETAATISGGEMFEAAVTSLTQSAGTATCTTTAAHGLVTGNTVVIRGAQPDGYNKVATVTVSSATVFTYAVDSGLGSPATGTPVVSFVAIYGLTDASGDISASRTWGANQVMKGWARKKNTTSPFYKDGDIGYTIDSSNGNTVNVVLQPDE